MVERIKIDLPVEPLLQLVKAVAVLRQQPHDLRHDGLNGHVVGLEEAEAVLDPLAHLVDAHIAALVSDLGGEDEYFVGLVVVAEALGEGVHQPLGDAAYAEALHDNTVVEAENFGRPGVSLSRKTRGLSERPNSTGPVGQGEGTYRTRRSPCTSASAGKFTEAKAS